MSIRSSRLLLAMLLQLTAARALAQAPTVVTATATSVTSSGATINGSGTPNGDATFGYFRYSTTDPGTCSDTFGTRAPPSSGSDTSLGSGTSPVAYARPLSGLTPATTYYYCALGRNGSGTSVGVILTFTTPAALPTATSNSATLLTGTTAQLNGTSNPGGADTTGWFRYATSSPGTCNDSFGTRAPASGGSSVGAGTSATAYAQAISGLTAGTTYYVCAMAQSSIGTSFGSVITFVTPLPPVVTTSAASFLTSSTASLNGSASPNGSSTSSYFRYGLTDPGTCDDTFGSRAPTSGGTALGFGASAVAFSQFVSGLSASTTYYFCAIASSAEGTSFGSVLSFTTSGPPTTATAGASPFTTTTATLNGSASPNGSPTTGWFRYSTTNPGACNDTFGSRAPPSGGSSLGNGAGAVAFSEFISGLSANTTYHLCAIASNAEGTSFGSVLSFTTLGPPPTVTAAATLVTSTTATLNGSANPNRFPTTGWFRYATTSPGTCNDTFGARAPTTGGASLGSGTTSVAYSQGLAGLTAGTTYYACAIAQSAVGIAFGSVLSFTTPAAPTVNTLAATPVTATTATLNASVNPGGSATTGWFRYDTFDPGTCTVGFGTLTPDVALGAGTSLVALLQPITGLRPATTYYYCALARNASGTSFDLVHSFTTPAAPPSVTMGAATLLTASTAQLNASATPNGSDTTGWIRYAATSPGACNDTFGTRVPATGGASLGAGTSAVAWSQPISGLSPGTTYYGCALASSAIGSSVGSVVSFTTPLPPTVSTAAATSVTSSSASLNGDATPHGAATAGWFRYATTGPGTCNDTFGSRLPPTGATSLGSGTIAIGWSQGVSGLAAGTTYYFCAIASSAAGTSFGSVLSFTTPSAPSATTSFATAISSSGATLNGAGTPSGAATTGWFRYASADPGSCDDTFGTRAPAGGGASLGAGTSAVAFAQPVSGLLPGTTYWFCAIGSNAYGLAYGALRSFTTAAAAPTVSTGAATQIASASAQLDASANPGGDATTGWFRYATVSPGTCNDTFGTRAPVTGGASLGSGTGAAAYAQAISGLSAGTTYFFCAIASNGAGTSFGALSSFTTTLPPTATTSAATSVTDSSASLNGAANPNGSASTGWFRYATVSPGTCNDAFGTRAPVTGGASLGSGTGAAAYAQAISGLSAGTTYFFCAIAASAEGTSFGDVLSFTTPSAPAATTSAATVVSSSGATLNGAGTPNGAATTAWFRYAATNPGACNDGFGTRAPAAGGASLGSGASAVAYAQALSGLLPATTYTFCAIDSNAYGTSLGALLSFTTMAVAPTVTTGAATLLTGSTAQLEGDANPGGDATTGWFRYATASPGTCNDTFGTRAPVTGGASLGAGTGAVAWSQGISGLSPGTTYYSCAVAANGVGTSFGAPRAFTTAQAPTVTTSAATTVTAAGAALNGAGNPNGAATTGWFRYDAVSPGTCNDTFGTRAPTNGGTSLGAGASSQDFSLPVSDLAPGTTYFFCAVAGNAEGTSLGDLLSFTTAPSTPAVVTSGATFVSSSGAALHGAATPNGGATTGWFRLATSHPGICDDTFGTRAPATGGATLGAGASAQGYAQAVAGLAPATTYFYCAVAQNGAGAGVGEVQSFTTWDGPSVTTRDATELTGTTATLQGAADPHLSATTGWFRFAPIDPVACDDAFGTRVPETGSQSLGAGAGLVDYSEPLTGLLPGRTSYVCAIAQSADGLRFGEVRPFTTAAAPPAVTSAPPTEVLAESAVLHGAADPNGDATTGWFRLDTAQPAGCDDAFGTRVPASGGEPLGGGTGLVTWAVSLSGLTPGTTYYACAVAANGLGSGFGEVVTFRTGATAPAVTTLAATDVTGTGATLEGTATPHGGDTAGWFRVGDADPGMCDDAFGARLPASGGVALGAGNAPVSFSLALDRLAPNRTYFFCAAASNLGGATFGAPVAFTSAAVVPSVRTAAALVDATGAVTLTGAANPNGAEAEGWFRYAATAPPSCSDAFGTRVPAAGAAALGAGRSEVALSQAVTGLAPGTYWFCAIASNAAGVAYGEVGSLEVAAPPASSGGCGCGPGAAGSAAPVWLAALLLLRRRRRLPCQAVAGTNHEKG